MGNKVSIWLLVSLLSVSWGARPLSTDDAGTVAFGEFETETGGDFISKDNHFQSLGFTFKHGLTNHMDIGISFPYEMSPEYGLGSAEVSMKYALLKQQKLIPAFSSSFTFLPGGTEYVLNGILSDDFNLFTTHVNFGYCAIGHAGKSGNLIYGMAFEFPVSSLNLVSEIYSEGELSNMEWIAGCNLELFEGFSFDFAGGSTVKSPVTAKVTMGITYGFKGFSFN
ncbi:MAG: hypothetical protein HQK83_10890 [Fibrobacteria bacterium]|nr:hypothetical protein [Fibrobacteria bacterium]